MRKYPFFGGPLDGKKIEVDESAEFYRTRLKGTLREVEYARGTWTVVKDGVRRHWRAFYLGDEGLNAAILYVEKLLDYAFEHESEPY